MIQASVQINHSWVSGAQPPFSVRLNPKQFWGVSIPEVLGVPG